MKQVTKKNKAVWIIEEQTLRRLVESGLFLLLGITLGMILQIILGNFWMTLVIGFATGSVVTSLSDHYRGLVAGIWHWFRKPIQQPKKAR